MLLMRWRLTAAVLTVLFVGVPAYGGDIIKFEDANGTIHFTDSTVPRSYKVYIKEKTIKRLEKQEKNRRFADEIRIAGNRHGVDRHLIQSVIQAESGFDPLAVSRAGARGLMQLMPETARRYDVNNVYNPAQNIDGGTRHLKHLMNKYGGNVKIALAAYNAGETVVADYSGIPPYPETKTYIARVLQFYKEQTGKDIGKKEKMKIYRYLDANGTLILTDTPLYVNGLR